MTATQKSSSPRKPAPRQTLLESARGSVDETISLFYLGYRAGVAGPKKVLDKLAFGRPHHRILYVVARRPGIAIANLIDLLEVSRQALHRPMRDLIAQGYLVQKPAPTNRRLTLLSLTPKGAALESRLTDLQYDAFAKAFSVTGPEAEQQWKAVMRALAEQVRPAFTV
ncbi:winged helix-turn-helix transcriptional regulator [Ferrovibrio terrae]|uniref:Winged helix-turn-helix transcriptional regulator n=1 Tax=Ferrovibrio terrae TaxID=2594003 RepID=A0A516GZB7_9PROT|nr:MarR family winged helix-turn-helix transcriptional regulator [Ferrovibrio terrae]QDO96873.1 winged helix-turn-helix transcriptional regulator [Ferrovibrio terrae]